MNPKGIEVVLDRTKLVEKALKELTENAVFIGVPEEKNAREDGSPFGNAARGYTHETGSPVRNIPARPHLVPGVEEAQERVQFVMRQAAKRCLMGDVGAAEKGLEAAGLVGQNSVRRKIVEGLAPSLSPTTVYARMHRRRNRRKSTNTTPLIDTGEYLKSITYVVKKGD